MKVLKGSIFTTLKDDGPHLTYYAEIELFLLQCGRWRRSKIISSQSTQCRCGEPNRRICPLIVNWCKSAAPVWCCALFWWRNWSCAQLSHYLLAAYVVTTRFVVCRARGLSVATTAMEEDQTTDTGARDVEKLEVHIINLSKYSFLILKVNEHLEFPTFYQR